MAEKNRNLTLQQVRSTALAEAKQFETGLLKACAPEKQIKPLITCCTASPIKNILFTPDGQTLISTCGPFIRLWDVKMRKFFQILGENNSLIKTIALTPDGQTLISLHNNSEDVIRIWDINTGRCKKRIYEHGYPRDLILGPDGHTVIEGGDSRYSLYVNTEPDHIQRKEITVWDLNTEEKLCYIETDYGDETGKLAISADGKTIVYGRSSMGSLCVADLASGKTTHILYGSGSKFSKIVVNPYGRMVFASSNQKTIHIWDLETANELCKIETGHGINITSLTITPDGRKVISGSYDKTMRVWDVQTGQLVQVISGSTSRIESTAISPDGQWVVCGCENGSIYHWDMQNGQMIREQQANTYPARTLTFIKNIQNGLPKRDGNIIHLLEQNKKSGICVILKKEFPWYIDAAAISPDGKRFAIPTGKRIQVFDFFSGDILCDLGETQLPAGSLAFSADGSLLLSTHSSRIIFLWDANSGGCLYSREMKRGFISKAIFSPDSKSFLINGHTGGPGGNYFIETWDVKLGAFLWEITIDQRYKDTITRVLAIHPHGKTSVLSFYKLPLILMIDMQTGETLRAFEGHTRPISALAISPDGKVLLSGSEDGTNKFWDYDSGELLATTYNLDEGYLWSTPPDALAEYGWLYTNHRDLISLMAVDPHDSSNVEYIPESDERFINYMKIYNDRDMVMKRISERTRFEELLRLRTSIQNEMNLKLLMAQTQNEALYLPRPGE